MTCLLDTSILVRLANASDPAFTRTIQFVEALRQSGVALSIAPQIVIEFRNAFTRPVAVNGLGFNAATADSQIAQFESLFGLISESPTIYPAWKSLVQAASITGKQVHDARIAAICEVNKIEQLATYNSRHFTRFATLLPALKIVDPNQP